MRIAFAILLALHGIAHLVGFAGSWQLAATGNIPYKTTVLGGHLDLGDAGIRAVGLLWVVAALAFVTVSAGAMTDTDWWPKAAMLVAFSSLALTTLELPQAKVGLAVNLGIIFALVLSHRVGLA